MWKFSTKTVDNPVNNVDNCCENCELDAYILCLENRVYSVPPNVGQTEVFKAINSV